MPVSAENILHALSGGLEVADLKYLALQPAWEARGDRKAIKFALCFYKTFKQKAQDVCVCCPKPSITIHTYDDVSVVRCSPCNVLPKPQRSRLIPAAFPYFHGHKPHREGQGSLESVPKPACCMWKRPLCHDPAAGLCIIPAFGDGCMQVLLQQIPPTK